METSHSRGSSSELDRIARDFVRLCFSLEDHCPGYIDAYFGPPELKEEGKRRKKSLPQIQEEASHLALELEKMEGGDPSRRARSLIVHLNSLAGKARLLQGISMSFDEESSLLYDATFLPLNLQDFRDIHSSLDSLLPGEGPLRERFQALREEFQVPPEKLSSLMERAIQEARLRTSQWISLPEWENFTFELVNNKPWSGYNWYKGNSQSLIQVNLDLPVYLDTIITLACHEGYPGHHLFNCLREEELYEKRGWVEFSVFPLFGSDALIAEGTANFAVEMVFPALEDRLRFESEVLCPLSGINPQRLELYENVLSEIRKLAYVQVEAARRYLDGLITREEALELLRNFRLLSSEEAEHSLRFIEYYRSYVINYKLGEDLVRSFVERQGGTGENSKKRWEVFVSLLANPTVPSDLQV